MAAFNVEKITHVHHWNDTLFSFKTTRDTALRFKNGQFVMIGLEVNGKPLMRAYSIASANYEEELEFFSIKVPDGPLTSRLQHLKEGDEIIVSRKATGTLVIDNLEDGRNLYLIGTGTGVTPYRAMLPLLERAIAERGVDLVDVSSGGNVVADIPLGPGYQVPLATEVQIPILFAGVRGLLDEIPVDKIVEWEATYRDELQSQPELLAEIGKGVFTKELEENLTKSVKNSVSSFVGN